MPGQLITEGQQLGVLQLVYTCQDLAFGISVFQRQVEIMQQPAEQASVQQAEGFLGWVAHRCSAAPATSSGKVSVPSSRPNNCVGSGVTTSVLRGPRLLTKVRNHSR